MTDYLINLFGNTIPGELTAFILSVVPLVELRGGILAAKALGVDMWVAFFLCAAGTMLPIPFILLFIRQILEWLKNTRLVRLVDKIELKAEKKIKQIEKYKSFGLAIFVAIPLPGTGAWSGALAAAIMKMRFRDAMLSITIGTLIADIIMCLISYGVLMNIL
ncbi:MAG: small multi-drug export protein [Oscillospiraceae bacterium]